MNWLKGLRVKNLAIVGINQFLLLAVLLLPVYRSLDIQPALSFLNFSLMVISTMLATSAGNVINDLYDFSIDLFNKPEKAWFTAGETSQVRIFYWNLNLLGWAIAWYVAIDIGAWHLNFLYPLAAFLLWSYSAYFKGQGLAGNFLIAFFCGMVSLLVLYAEREGVQEIRTKSGPTAQLIVIAFWSYAAFAFMTTMIRELIKDIEDMEGDSQADCRTFPVRSGLGKSKILLRNQFVLLLMSLGILLTIMGFSGFWLGLLAGILVLAIPGLIVCLQLVKATERDDFTRLSKWMKAYMLLGLLYLPLFSSIYLI